MNPAAVVDDRPPWTDGIVRGRSELVTLPTWSEASRSFVVGYSDGFCYGQEVVAGYSLPCYHRALMKCYKVHALVATVHVKM